MSYTQIALITEELFKLNSPVSRNADITEFIPYISIAQQLFISDILGEPLMEELKEQISNNTLTPTNGDLIIKIAPCLSFYAVYQALPFHWVSIVNKGLTKGKSENSEPVDIKDVAQLRRWILDSAQILQSQLITFLCQCRTNYPLWRPSNNCCNDIINEGSTEKKFESGFFFPTNKNGCGCN